MANLITKFTTILFLAMLLLHSQPGTSSTEDDDASSGEDDEEYVLDAQANDISLGRSRSRFLAGALIVKKGTRCNRLGRNVCNGVRANKGKSLLFCCKKHCRNILTDRNHCGRCGNRCRFGQRCCGRRCTNVLFNRRNCGRCGKKCNRGDSCTFGICGNYAN